MLAKEGEDTTTDIAREIKSLTGYLEVLETHMLLSGGKRPSKMRYRHDSPWRGRN